MLNYIKSIASGVNLSFWSVSAIQIADILDILLVAYLIYTVITWVQKTRAWSVFKGIGVVLFLMVVSYMLGLNTVYWIIKNAFNVGIIALMVLFQPELRRALELLGKGGKMSGLFSTADSQMLTQATVHEVIEAAVEMAKVKTGALIVIEQRVPLEDCINTGTVVDAQVSAQLLINIFEKNTPLHDGAVIIRNNRVAAASCVLPLTEEDLDKNLGTRHRAAVGASELSDAAVVVVSEETGTISVSKAGKLFRGLDRNEITELLLDEPRGVLKGRAADEQAV